MMYVKKPLRVKAIQYNGDNLHEILTLIEDLVTYDRTRDAYNEDSIVIRREKLDSYGNWVFAGDMFCELGDYLIIEEDTQEVYSVSESYFNEAFTEYVDVNQTQLIQERKQWME